MRQLIHSFLIIFLSLLCGYVIQLLIKKEYFVLPFSLEKIRKFLQKLGLLFLMPIIIFGVYWVMDFQELKFFLFPFLGIFNLIFSGMIALFIAKLLSMNPKDAGSFFCCGFFSNFSNIGGLICFLFFGEEGYKLVLLYTLFVRILNFTLGFPVAKYYAIKANKEDNSHFNFNLVMKDPFVVAALVSIIAGLSLNASGIERPTIYSSIIAIFIPANTIVLLVSIGISTHLNKIKIYLREALLINGLKFIIMPIVMVSLGFLLGYHRINQALPLKIILILSSSPAAFVALIPPSQYGLNLDLANSCWIFNTLSMAFVIPILFFLLRII